MLRRLLSRLRKASIERWRECDSMVAGMGSSVYTMIHRFIEASHMDRGQAFGTQRQVGRAAVLTIPSPSTQRSFRSGLDHMTPQTYTRSMSGTSLLENGLLACSNVTVSSLGLNSLLMTTVTASEFLIAEMATYPECNHSHCLARRSARRHIRGW